MIYRLPETSDREHLSEYVREHHEYGETSISASLGLSSAEYSEWVNRIQRNGDNGDPVWGKSLLYLCLEQERLVGLLSIRYDMSRELAEKYGHIGYGVRPSERRKGFGSQMLCYALSVCREKGLKQVIVGCYKDNYASAATIRKNGGKLIAENENYKAGRVSQYYVIELDQKKSTACL